MEACGTWLRENLTTKQDGYENSIQENSVEIEDLILPKPCLENWDFCIKKPQLRINISELNPTFPNDKKMDFLQGAD